MYSNHLIKMRSFQDTLNLIGIKIKIFKKKTYVVVLTIFLVKKHFELILLLVFQCVLQSGNRFLVGQLTIHKATSEMHGRTKL